MKKYLMLVPFLVTLFSQLGQAQVYKYTPEPSLWEKMIVTLLSEPPEVETYIFVSEGTVISVVFSDDDKTFTLNRTDTSKKYTEYLSCERREKVLLNATYVDTRKYDNEFYIGPDLTSNPLTDVYTRVSAADEKSAIGKLKKYRRKCENDSVKEDQRNL